MNQKKLSLVLVGLLFMVFHTKAQQSTYYSPDLSWMITTPYDIAMRNELPQHCLNTGIDKENQNSSTKALFALRAGSFNYMDAVIQPFVDNDNSWRISCDQTRQVLLHVLADQFSECKIDTTSTEELIGGVRFEVFGVTLTYRNNLVLHTYYFHSLHKGFDLTIKVGYTDADTGEKMLSSLRRSRFDVSPPQSEIQKVNDRQVVLRALPGIKRDGYY